MLKIVIKIAIVLAALSIIGLIVPSPITDPINEAFIYFLSFANYLAPVVNIATFFLCLKIIMTFTITVATFYGMFWIITHFN